MKGFLKKAISIKVMDKDPIVIPKGAQVDLIDFRYLPDHIKAKLNIRQIREFKERSKFIFYSHSKFVSVSKENIDIPKTYGWQHNL